jgi:hypothetical protein
MGAIHTAVKSAGVRQEFLLIFEPFKKAIHRRGVMAAWRSRCHVANVRGGVVKNLSAS